MGKDFGNQGANYPVAEESVLLMFQKNSAALDLKKRKKEKECARRQKERVRNPIPVFRHSATQRNKGVWHDPTYILTEDAVLLCGRVLYRAGTE